jgi:hypothetical protein
MSASWGCLAVDRLPGRRSRRADVKHTSRRTPAVSSQRRGGTPGPCLTTAKRIAPAGCRGGCRTFGTRQRRCAAYALAAAQPGSPATPTRPGAGRSARPRSSAPSWTSCDGLRHGFLLLSQGGIGVEYLPPSKVPPRAVAAALWLAGVGDDVRPVASPQRKRVARAGRSPAVGCGAGHHPVMTSSSKTVVDGVSFPNLLASAEPDAQVETGTTKTPQ